ncbi:MAG TPA: undecaprenyl-diphosphatase UppP [Candidatus Limnocylindria bacterium]|nr:undecaprenyl-diphosphatase UppP [Candidatus Limnocylindria bacterium]
METILQAIVVGIVQGLTEFLPISSSGHLILLPRVLGWDNALINSPAFVVVLHLGSVAALLLYFGRDLWRYALAGLAVLRYRRVGSDPDRRMALLLAASVIPAALIGVALEDFVDTFFREQLLAVVLLLAAGGVILFLSERAARHTRGMEELRIRDALLIGLAQALALFPGISRSGITISAGLLLGLERAAAARFAFLMGTPIIAGAGVWKMREFFSGDVGVFDPVVLLAGLLGATVSSLLAIAVLLAYLRRHSTDIFVAYRLAAAAVFGALLLWR